MLWHKESQRGHYDCATPGLEGLNRASQTETLVSKVGHSAKLKSLFKTTSQNGTLDSIYSTFPVHSVSADFKKVYLNWGGYMVDQPLHQLHHGMLVSK